jgi:hypothetical protein
MKALRRCAKKLFNFRKIVWLFLCGMLIIVEEAGAQQGDPGNKQPAGGNGTAITQPVDEKYWRPPSSPRVKPPHRMTKYGPPSSFKRKPIDAEKPDQGLTEKTLKAD